MSTSSVSPSSHHCTSVYEVVLSSFEHIDNEETIESEQRQSADGGSLEVLVAADAYTLNTEHNGESCKDEQQKENITQDLDEDVVEMFEYNVQHGQIDCNGAASIDGISIDSTVDPFPRSENEGWRLNSVHNIFNGQAVRKVEQERGQTEGSEKSFTSDTDSSVLAESVVKRVLDKAVNVVRSEYHLGKQLNTNRYEDITDAKVENKGDVKVGLFQYTNNDEDDDDEDDDDEDVNDNLLEGHNELDNNNLIQEVTGNVEPSYTGVGFFRYDQQGNTDITEGQAKSFNEDDQENILKLYGLEEVETSSPKSPSPSYSRNPLEGMEAETVVDVQQDVYLPQARKFSMTRDPSSGESTPRTDHNGDLKEKLVNDERKQYADEIFVENIRFREVGSNGLELLKNVEMDTDTQKNGRSGDIDVEDIDHRILVEAVSSFPISVSPPLIHYESVKENGKFRIIKTTKEGADRTNTGFRVWTDTPSQEPTQFSDNGSPRETVTSLKESQILGDNQNISPRIAENHISHRISDNHNISPRISDNQNISPRISDNNNSSSIGAAAVLETLHFGKSVNTIVSTSEKQSGIEIDREIIRKLVEKEEVHGSKLSSDDLYSPVHSESNEPLSGSNINGLNLETDLNSSKQMSLSELTASPLLWQQEMKRRNYVTRDTSCREMKRIASKPCTVEEVNDKLVSESIYLKVSAVEKQPERERIMPYVSNRNEDSKDSGYPTTMYRQDLLHSAYERIANQSSDASHSLYTTRSTESAILPGFKTLQNQQAKWSEMFNTLEEDHRRELLLQYEQHQYNVQRLQQQIEFDLQKQYLAIRKKLDIHKEALAKMSPEREGSSSNRFRSLDRNTSPEREVMLSQSSARAMDQSPDRSYAANATSLQNSFDSKTWREIYQEMRAEEERRSPSPTRPIKHALDSDFATIDTTLEMPRPSRRASPPGGRSVDILRFASGERSSVVEDQQRTLQRTPEKRPLDSKYSKSETDRSLGVEKVSRKRSPEDEARLLAGRAAEYRSDVKDTGPVPYLNIGDGPHHDGVSRHVKELLDNLNDSRHSLHNIEDDVTLLGHYSVHSDTIMEPPRAGVYSSPMPLFRGRKGTPDNTTIDGTRLLASLDLSGDRAEFHKDAKRGSLDVAHSRLDDVHVRNHKDDDILCDTVRSDDFYLSPRMRMSLREKHAKHLADLRAYYEDELRELRKALSESLDASIASANRERLPSHIYVLEVENKQLIDKCRAMQDEIDDLYLNVRELEQKNVGLERRSTEYANAYADMQGTCMQHRVHIEELQRYCSERDELIKELLSKLTSNDDCIKIYKKNLDEEIELHRQDKMSLTRMMDRYESLQSEYKLLRDAVTSTENNLYEARTDLVEVNRTISKLELENKRLGRENDNLRHKVTQSLNLTAHNKLFVSPTSPTEVKNHLGQRSPIASLNKNLSNVENSLGTVDARLPLFSTSVEDWNNSSQKSSSKIAPTVVNSRNASHDKVLYFPEKMSTDSLSSEALPGDKVSMYSGRESEESLKEKHSQMTKRPKDKTQESSSSMENLTQRTQQQLPQNVNEQPTRDVTRREVTPTRPFTPNNIAESEVSDYSPLLKAERELYKLRDMMRQAVAIKPSFSPPQPKLQKKFYGSERPTPKDEYVPDFGVAKGRKDKPGASSSNSSVPKSKSNHPQDKSNEKSSGKHLSLEKQEKGLRLQDKFGKERPNSQKETERSKQRQKTSSSFREENNSSIRSNIAINEEKKTLNVTPKKVANQSVKQRDVGIQVAENQSRHGTDEASQGKRQHENTLDKMQQGQFPTRSERESAFTTQVKLTDVADKPKSMEENLFDRFHSIAEMESQYDGLQNEKRQLESSINKIPLHGRVDRNNRRHKEELEERLDQVGKELGSVRMSLKRCNVLKTAG